jgi:hypothetical protein
MKVLPNVLLSHIEKIKYKISLASIKYSLILKFLLLILFQHPKAAILTQIPLQKAECDIVMCAMGGFFRHPIRDVRNQRRNRKKYSSCEPDPLMIPPFKPCFTVSFQE